MAFIQDPRLRQRWNQISHNAEAVTENAAASIWTLQHRYLHPCLAAASDVLDGCTSACLCLGDREERARRARERDRGARRARPEYMFDFYDDWDDFADDEGGGVGGMGGMGGGSWTGSRAEDWDRLLAGTGSVGRGRHAVVEDAVDHQPRRKRGMSYGTRSAPRRPSNEDDPTIIPSTAPLGFLGRLPFKIGGPLRYRPSAANLRDHPGAGGGVGEAPGAPEDRDGEYEPLLGTSDDDYDDGATHQHRAQDGHLSPQPRPRSGTTGSGDTSSSYRSRGDLFPSDGEGEEDAVPLDDEFAVALDRVDDRASNKTRSSKGKRPVDGRTAGSGGLSRTVSRTTLSSIHTTVLSPAKSINDLQLPQPASLEDLRREEQEAAREEAEAVERKRRAASRLASKRGLSRDGADQAVAPVTVDLSEVESKAKSEAFHVDKIIPEPPDYASPEPGGERGDTMSTSGDYHHKEAKEIKDPITTTTTSIGPVGRAADADEGFVPARLPRFR